MDDKKVILNKTEFDSMETELNNLRQIVESRTVSIIVIPKLTWSHLHLFGTGSVGDYNVQYVAGRDENEVVKELSDEIKRLKELTNTYENQVYKFQNQKDDWKFLPWYKRLFIK